MVAISKAWVTISDGAVDPDSPVDTALMTGFRDCLVHLREWLGASFYAGAVQDHNHDGVNSALIEVGPNYVRNGSFESGGTAAWDITPYTGGSINTNTANDMDGATALAFTSTDVSNGGGEAASREFIAVSGGRSYSLSAMVKGSGAGVSCRLEGIWYSDAQAQISATTVFTETSTPTSASLRGGIVVAPSAARYAKLKFTGGVPGVGSSAGTVYVDGIQMGRGAPTVLPGTAVLVEAGDSEPAPGSSFAKAKEVAIHVEGRVRVTFDVAQTLGSVGDGQVWVNGSAVGAVVSNNGTTPAVSASEDVDVAVGDLVQVYVRQLSGGGEVRIKNMKILTATQMVPHVVL